MKTLKIIFRNLVRRPGRLVFTSLGITVGIAAFVTFLSMGGNLRSEVIRQADSLGAHIIVSASSWCPFERLSILTGDHLPESISWSVVEEIREIEGITAVIPYLTLGTAIQNTPLTLTGILPGEMKIHRGWRIQDGKYFTEENQEAIVIGANVATRFELSVNDEIMVRGQNFSIIAVLEPNGSNDDIGIFMPLSVVQETYGINNYVSFIAVMVDDLNKIDYYVAEITDIGNLGVSTDEQLLNSVLMILGSVNITLQLIAGVALLAAAFGIVNTMLMSIHERKREIGILRAIGKKRTDIFRIFLIESGVYGFLGGFAGLILGGLVSYYLAPLISQNEVTAFLGSTDNIMLDPFTLISVLTFSILIAVLAGLYPAWKASKLTPMEAIRNG